MSEKKEIEIIDTQVEVDAQKRGFMKKMGKYAVVGAGMSVLMTPSESSANCYKPSCVPKKYKKYIKSDLAP